MTDGIGGAYQPVNLMGSSMAPPGCSTLSFRRALEALRNQIPPEPDPVRDKDDHLIWFALLQKLHDHHRCQGAVENFTWTTEHTCALCFWPGSLCDHRKTWSLSCR